MKKIAFFVEGQTEQIFVTKLIQEIAGRNNVTISLVKAHYGDSQIIKYRWIKHEQNDEVTEYYVLICDCGQDKKVIPAIRNRDKSLRDSGYDLVIGLRDLYPFRFSDLLKVRRYEQRMLRLNIIATTIIVAIMEIEAWFLAETTHYERIHRSLTLQRIQNGLGYNLLTHNVESFCKPSDELDKIYQLVNKHYSKKKNQIHKLVEKLDYENVYLNLANRIQPIKQLVDEIDSFLN